MYEILMLLYFSKNYVKKRRDLIVRRIYFNFFLLLSLFFFNYFLTANMKAPLDSSHKLICDNNSFVILSRFLTLVDIASSLFLFRKLENLRILIERITADNGIKKLKRWWWMLSWCHEKVAFFVWSTISVLISNTKIKKKNAEHFYCFHAISVKFSSLANWREMKLL